MTPATIPRGRPSDFPIDTTSSRTHPIPHFDTRFLPSDVKLAADAWTILPIGASARLRRRPLIVMPIERIDDVAIDLVHDDWTRELIWDSLVIARRRAFGVDRPDDAVQLLAHADLDDVVIALAKAGFTPRWKLSYHYEGEDVNLVRFWYDPALEYPFRQDHVRLFETEYPEGVVGVAPHTEASALMHRSAHLDEVTFDLNLGRARTREVLESESIPVTDALDEEVVP